MSLSLLIMAAWFSVAFVPVDQSAIQGNVMVRGKVVHSEMGRGIGGAVVTATSEASVETTTTDADGNFFFLTLLPGNYKFAAQAYGFVDQCLVRPPNVAYELDAGYEYMATISLFNECK